MSLNDWRQAPEGPFDDRQVVPVARMVKPDLEHQLVLDAVARSKPMPKKKSTRTKKKEPRKMKVQTVEELTVMVLAVSENDYSDLVKSLDKLSHKSLEQLQALLIKLDKGES